LIELKKMIYRLRDNDPELRPWEDRLRDLSGELDDIDEMLAEIRAAASEENWTSDARKQAEADLARIMDQVRREAMRAEPKSKRKRDGK